MKGKLSEELIEQCNQYGYIKSDTLLFECYKDGRVDLYLRSSNITDITYYFKIKLKLKM